MGESEASVHWPEPTIEETVAKSKIQVNTPYGLQDGNGVDLTLIIENLKLSVEQRIIQGERARLNAEYILEYARSTALAIREIRAKLGKK